MKKSLVACLVLVLSTAGYASPVINEFVLNHTGTDTFEFVELFDNSGVDLSGLRILEIEGDTTGSGIVDEVIQPGTTGANGIWNSAYLSNALENGTVTLLLVEGFSGALGNDIDSANNGTIDNPLWTNIIDCVGISDAGTGDNTYCSTTLAPSFDGGTLTVGGASRIPNGVDTDSVSDWVRNDFDGEGLPGFPSGTLGPGEALNTPREHNQIPEPGTLALLGLGLGALLRRR